MVGSSLSNGGPQSSQPGTGEQDKSHSIQTLRAAARRLMHSLKCFHSLWWEIVQIKPQTLWHETLIPKHVPWVKRGTFLRVTNGNKVSVQRLDRYPFPCMSLTCPSCVPGVSLTCPTTAETGVERVKWKVPSGTKVWSHVWFVVLCERAGPTLLNTEGSVSKHP